MKKPSGRMRAVLIAVLTAAFFQLPAFGISKKDLVIGLKEKRIRDLSSGGLTLAFHVGIRNLSSAPCRLVRYDNRVTVNQKEFLRMPVSLDEPITVGGGEEITISLPVKFSYDLLFAAMGPIEEKAACDAVGDFVFADAKGKEEKIPFAFSGEFPIFKDPELELLPLRVNDLTVGGGDVVFDVRVKNANSYDLIVSTFAFKLSFGERTVLEGEIPGDKSIPGRGDKVFSLPFLLDFFDAGKEVYDLFQKPPVPCRFTGRILIDSVWGMLPLDFDRAGPLALAERPE